MLGKRRWERHEERHEERRLGARTLGLAKRMYELLLCPDVIHMGNKSL